MTKESFIQDRHFFRFEVTPLDVNLAKIQMNLEKRTMQELPDSGNFGAIIEKFELFNPTTPQKIPLQLFYAIGNTSN